MTDCMSFNILKTIIAYPKSIIYVKFLSYSGIDHVINGIPFCGSAPFSSPSSLTAVKTNYYAFWRPLVDMKYILYIKLVKYINQIDSIYYLQKSIM